MPTLTTTQLREQIRQQMDALAILTEQYDQGVTPATNIAGLLEPAQLSGTRKPAEP